ncbi:MAG: hypothetical protein Q9208_002118 [Pyrenodesmia sp. 3 TL-2023]
MTSTGQPTAADLQHEIRHLTRQVKRLEADLDEMTELRDEAVKASQSSKLSSTPAETAKQLHESNQQLMELLSHANQELRARGQGSTERCDKLERDRDEALKSLYEKEQEMSSFLDQITQLMDQNHDLRERNEELEKELRLARPGPSSARRGTEQPPVESEERRLERVRALAAEAASSTAGGSTKSPQTQQNARQLAPTPTTPPTPAPASARQLALEQKMAASGAAARAKQQARRAGNTGQQPNPQPTSTPTPAPAPVSAPEDRSTDREKAAAPKAAAETNEQTQGSTNQRAQQPNQQPTPPPTSMPASARQLALEQKMAASRAAARAKQQTRLAGTTDQQQTSQPKPPPTANPHAKEDKDQSLQPGAAEPGRAPVLPPHSKGKGKGKSEEYQPEKPETPILQSKQMSQPEGEQNNPLKAASSTGKAYAAAAKAEPPRPMTIQEGLAKLLAAKDNKPWESPQFPGIVIDPSKIKTAPPVAPVPEPTLSLIPGKSRSQPPSPDAAPRQKAPVPRPPPHKSLAIRGKSRLVKKADSAASSKANASSVAPWFPSTGMNVFQDRDLAQRTDYWSTDPKIGGWVVSNKRNAADTSMSRGTTGAPTGPAGPTFPRLNSREPMPPLPGFQLPAARTGSPPIIDKLLSEAPRPQRQRTRSYGQNPFEATEPTPRSTSPDPTSPSPSRSVESFSKDGAKETRKREAFDKYRAERKSKGKQQGRTLTAAEFMSLPPENFDWGDEHQENSGWRYPEKRPEVPW